MFVSEPDHEQVINDDPEEITPIAMAIMLQCRNPCRPLKHL